MAQVPLWVLRKLRQSFHHSLFQDGKKYRVCEKAPYLRGKKKFIATQNLIKSLSSSSNG